MSHETHTPKRETSLLLLLQDKLANETNMKNDEIRPLALRQYIVACQRGGVSNKPPWAPGSDKTWGQGSFDPFLPRQGEPGTSQYTFHMLQATNFDIFRDT